MNISGHREYIDATNTNQLVAPFQIPGCWIAQTCAQKGCDKLLGYWSKSGKPKPEHKNAKCKKHGGKV